MGIEQWEWDLALYGRVYFRWEERGVEGGREVVGKGSGRAVNFRWSLFSVVPRDFAVFTFQPKPSKSWIPRRKMQFYTVGHSLHGTLPQLTRKNVTRAYFALQDSLRTRLVLELYSLAM